MSRIARLGRLLVPVPALEYGGTERTMAQISAFQAALSGHDVTVYASADSTLVSFAHHIALRLGLAAQIDAGGESVTIVNANGTKGRVRLRHTGVAAIGFSHPDEQRLNDALTALFLRDEAARPYDIVHSHAGSITIGALIPHGLGHKTITHIHNPALPDAYGAHRYPLIAISDNQAALLREKFNANIAGVVPHGLDSFTYDATTGTAGYLAWIGRFLEEKGAHRAIAIARAAGMPLLMAGTIYDKKPGSLAHFNAAVRPHIDIHDPEILSRMAAMSPAQARAEISRLQAATGTRSPVVYAGPADEAQKQALYGYADATLFPISWPEPFGRVMIESMACGTPVIGYGRFAGAVCGAVGNVIDHGRTGFVIDAGSEADGIEKAAGCVARAGMLDRSAVRHVFDARWTSERVARQIDAVYRAMGPA